MMKRVRSAVGVCVLGWAFGISPGGSALVHAGSGLDTWRWGDAGVTLSSTSYKYSNMSGLWQAVVNSLGSSACSISVDGVYGNITTWYTAIFQSEILGYNNGGVMTPGMLNAIHGSVHPVYGSRLIPVGYVDAYATAHYYYYGGANGDETRLGWNPFSSQWLFSQFPFSNPYLLQPALSSRTIGSVAACQ